MKTSLVLADVSAQNTRPKIEKARKIISKAQQWRLYILHLIANDLIMVILAFELAYWIRFELTLPFFQTAVTPSQPFYSSLILLLVPLWLVIFTASGLYSPKNLLGGTDEYALVFRATTIGLMVVVLAGFLGPNFIIARGWVLMAWGFSFFLTASGRFWLRRVIYLLRRSGYFISPAVIVGANDEGVSLARQIANWPTSGLQVVGFLDKKLPTGATLTGDLAVLGGVEEIDEIIQKYAVEEVILASSAVSSHDKKLDIFEKYGFSDQVNVRMSSGLYELITTGLTVKEFAYVPLVGVEKLRLTGLDRVIKFALDYGVAIPLLLVLSPFLLAIAIAIKLDSHGPVLHRRGVMGVNGRQFDAFKFRTMYSNGDALLAQQPALLKDLEKNHKLKEDPRITRLGKYLRRFSLDEFPQLINVLKREMSLVGPRMISPEEMGEYDQWGINLLTVQPGITGLWQVSGRSDVTYQERVRLDMYYIRNWSIWLDLHLLVQTIPAVLKGKGAY